MIVMQHLIQYKMPGQRESVESVGLVVYGDPAGHSAMAKTVGFPVGIVAHMMLKGRNGVVVMCLHKISCMLVCLYVWVN